MSKKFYTPRSMMIEKVAAEFCATWFEAAANTPGMSMERHKYKNNPKLFAQKNLEKFIPQAINILLDMLKREDIALELKEEIYNELRDRMDDPANVTSDDMKSFLQLDAKKLIDLMAKPVDKVNQLLERKRDKPLVIDNPYKAQRH